MPDHFHLLVSPTLSLERSLQLIKGGFSYRAKKELGFAGEVAMEQLRRSCHGTIN
jgi:putative transposase